MVAAKTLSAKCLLRMEGRMQVVGVSFMELPRARQAGLWGGEVLRRKGQMGTMQALPGTDMRHALQSQDHAHAYALVMVSRLAS